MPDADVDPVLALKKPFRAWKIARIAGILFMIFFIPSLRSCGQITVGLPFVAISERSSSGFHFHWLNLALNVAVAAVVILAATLALKAVKRAKTRTTLMAGFDFVGIYASLVLVGYLVVLPLCANSKDNTIGGAIFIGYAFFIYPWFDIMSEIANSFPDAIAASPLFGDSYDLPMRLGFLLMCLAWFGLGCLAAAIARSAARKRERPGQPVS
jgi:hypothetical protein